jgi:DNA polymerase-1
MINIHERLEQGRFGSKMLLQVHDELVFEVPKEEADIVAKLVRESMESVIKLDVPLVVNTSMGKNLAKV